MARIEFVKESELTGEAKSAYDAYVSGGKLTNMKQALLKDYATHKAFMGWYDSWNRLTEVVGLRTATIFAHTVSTTNGCILCSLFFISDIKELGEDPNELVLSDKEKLLTELGEQIVKDPNGVSDELFGKLKAVYSDEELIVIVGFAAQMIATNNFNSVLQIDVDKRLLPIKNEFKQVTWRDGIK